MDSSSSVMRTATTTTSTTVMRTATTMMRTTTTSTENRYHNHFNHQKKSFTLLSDENHYQHQDNGLPFANIEKQSITSISITERNKNHQKEQKSLPCNDSCGTIVDSYGTDGLAVIVCYLQISSRCPPWCPGVFQTSGKFRLGKFSNLEQTESK